jgi:formylglycine-generating enzyme required for sulfatase activity
MPSDAFLLQEGKEFGPFSASQLKQLAAAGKIGPDDVIRKGQDGQPMPARKIAGLAEAFEATASPPSKTAAHSIDAAWLTEVLSDQDKTVEPSRLPPRIDNPRRGGLIDASEGSDPSWLTTERVPPGFDPYHIWLGIPKGKRPPTHYQLLRIASGEHADEVIEAAAERQSEYVRKCRIGEYATFADRILYEIDEAKLCLLNPRLRTDYDAKLAEGKPKPTTKPLLPPPSQTVGEGNEIVRTYLGIVSIILAAFIIMAIVTFMLPWQKVIFSKRGEQPEAAIAGGQPAANQQAAGLAGNPANVPQKQIPQIPNVGKPIQPGALARNKPPAAPPIQANAASSDEPRPALLTAPFDEVTAKDAQKSWASHLKTPVQLNNSIGMRFILIPPGEFQMGSDDERLPADVRPVHRVRITKLLYFGAYEVTQREFERVMGFNPSKFSEEPRNPVESVPSENMTAFYQKLSELPDEKRAGRTYRLPTEAEWEYSCRAGSNALFHFGDRMSSSEANFNGENPPQDLPRGPNLARTAQVGSYGPNSFGLFDMHGNVTEAVSDWYSADYYSMSPVDDPQGPDPGELRVGRGGSWRDQAVPSAFRFKGPNSTVADFVGFRVVCEIPTTGGALTPPRITRPTVQNPANRTPPGAGRSPGL